MRFTKRSLLKVLVFCLGTGLMIALVGVTFARVRVEDTNTFHAVVANSSGLKSGSEVRGSGVAIGRVNEVKLHPGGGVEITFTAASHVTLTQGTEAQIRYANLIGDRYLDLTRGNGGARLRDGATIALQRTKPALELDDFFAGFDPLMRALDPEQVNQLSQNILAVTQGQAGSVQAMLSTVATFTSGLASRDELIGEVISSLSKALALVDNQRGEFDDLITGTSALLDGLAKDRESIGSSIAAISRAAADVTQLLAKVRPSFGVNVEAIGRLSANLLSEEQQMRDILGHLATSVHKAGRLGPYGSFFDFFLCSVQVRVVTNDNPSDTTSGIYSPIISASDERCKFPKDR